MPIAPKPSKFICKDCGYSVVIIHKSDCLSTNDLPPSKCPKCKNSVCYERKRANAFDIALAKLKEIL